MYVPGQPRTPVERELEDAKAELASASRARSRAIIRNPLGLDLGPYNAAIEQAQQRVAAARTALLAQEGQ